MIRVALPSRLYVTLTVFNALGQLAATLVAADIDADYQEAAFNASALASGVNLFRLQARASVQTKAMCLVR